VAVYGVRRDLPREAELKELEKSRAAGRKGGGNEPPGSILHEYWLGIEGSEVVDLLKSPLFQGKPSGSSMRDLFEAPRDMNDRFGARMRGFVHAPVTGPYTFWISSDDGSELFLSSDDSPLKKRSIASSPTGGIRDWTRAPSCKSAPIPLVAGKRYYIEALQKEGGGNDHLAVGWTLPDGTDERPIPGKRLSPWVNVSPIAVALPAANFYRAFNFNGPTLTIDGRKFEGKGAPDLQVAGTTFEMNQIPLQPSTDEARTTMIHSFVFSPDGTWARVDKVPPGNYQVYLYVWEDNNPQTLDFLVQGQAVLKGYNSGAAGHWERLGPWPAAVTDGILEVRGTGGDANFCGLELWRSGALK
jgi:hypothetical protein